MKKNVKIIICILMIIIGTLSLINVIVNNKKYFALEYRIQTNDNKCEALKIDFNNTSYGLFSDKNCEYQIAFMNTKLKEKDINKLLNKISDIKKIEISNNTNKNYFYIKIRYNKFKIIEKKGYVDSNNKIYKTLLNQIKEIK